MKDIAVRVDNLFGSLVWQEYLNYDTDIIANECLYRRTIDLGRTVSNKGGWQSNELRAPDSFFDNHPLLPKLIQSGNTFAQSLGLKELQLNNIWININCNRDYNIRHDHPGCILSGVYYVKAPKNSGNIEFIHPLSKVVYREWEDAIVERNDHNSSLRFYHVEDDMLLLFPGWLDHQVQPSSSIEERISISFNLVVK